MPTRFPVHSVALFLTATAAAGLCLLTVPQRDRKGAWPLMGVLTAITIWSGAYGMLLATRSPADRLFWHNVRFLGPSLLALSVFAFALQYAGRDHLLTRRRLVVLAVVPVLTNVLVWTNPLHGLIREAVYVTNPDALVKLSVEWGSWYLVHTGYSYALVGAAMVLFAETGLRYGQRPSVVRRTRLILVATALPLAANLLYTVGVTGFDLTPFGFTLGGVTLLAATVVGS